MMIRDFLKEILGDSFFAGSRGGADDALRLIDEGADIIDIGGESTRPGSSYVDCDEEIRRIVPVIEEIRRHSAVPVSVDTRKKAVMEAAYNAGADILNDVSALEDDGDMASFAAATGIPVILMHKRGIPTIVWMTPILPFINDTEENITSILNECVRVGVKGVIDFGMGLTLREGDREYYYAALDKHFPGMKERYIRQYGNAYELPSPHAKELRTIFQRICKENGLLLSPKACFEFMQELPEKYSQMSLFDMYQSN